jgi:predicted O-methyltransferase YrrM
MKPAEINAVMEIPEETRYVSIKEDEAAFLYEFVRRHGFQKTLETGLGYGRSALHIIAAHGKNHIAIDPFQSDYDYLALKNAESAGMRAQLDFIEDHSHHALPFLARETEGGEKFDFIFIDGDHKFDGILIDFYYADLLLKKGGYILFHDTWMRSTQLVASFIRRNKKNYATETSPLRNFLIFRKTGNADDRDGMHFREFYTGRSRLRSALIHWMLSPGDSLLKRTALRLKNMVK